MSGLCVTKLDVLDGLEVVRLGVGYRNAGGEDAHPVSAEDYAACEPIYEEMPGWRESTEGAVEWSQLPNATRRYLARIEELVGVPIDMISTGADRTHTIIQRHPFD